MMQRIRKRIKKYRLQQLFKERKTFKLKSDPFLLGKILEELDPVFFNNYQRVSSSKTITVNTSSLVELSNVLETMGHSIDPKAPPPKNFFEWAVQKEMHIGEFITVHQNHYVSPKEEIARFKKNTQFFLKALSFSFKQNTGIEGRYSYVCKPFIGFLTELTIMLIEDSLNI